MQVISFICYLILILHIAQVTISVEAAKAKSYYEILGVKKDATEKQLKREYHKLSLKYHPDKNPGDEEAKKKFVEVANAYEVLMDKEKRKIYDQHGEEGLKKHGQQGGRDPFDIFSQFGFGGFGGQHKQEAEEKRGPDITMDMQATLADLYTGKTIEVAVKNQVLCPKCRGTGAKDENDVKTCESCQGRGIKVTMHQLGPGFVQQMQSTCDVCGGKGKIATSTCPHCKGHKIVTGQRLIDVVIEQGMKDGQTIEFENGGDEHPDHAAGHLYFKIITAPHPFFTRRGDDLLFTQHISLLEALVGFTKTITHLDGHTVELKRTKVTDHGFVMKLKNEGMPVHQMSSQRGILEVTIVVDFPHSLTQQQKDGFAKLL